MMILARLRRLAGTSQDYRSAFATEAGQAVLVDLYRRHVRPAAVAPGDPMTTAYNAGRKDVVLAILANTALDPALFGQIAAAAQRQDFDDAQSARSDDR